MAATQNPVPGQQGGSKPSPDQQGDFVKEVALIPLFLLPEADRPDPEPFIEFFRKAIAQGVHEEDGRRSFPMFSLKLAKWVFSNWTPWENDVIVASFPKTGTTWVYNIATEILYKDEPKIKEMLAELNLHRYLETGISFCPVVEDLNEVSREGKEANLRVHLQEKYDIFEKYPWKRRLLGTHLSEELVNVQKITSAGGKIICTIRNPKDQMVSLYHMVKKVPINPKVIKELIGDGWNDYFKNVIAGKIPNLQKENEWYPDHLLGWYKHKNNDNILFVVFEDLKINPEKEIRRIAKFLNVDLSDEEMANIMKATSFQSMKQNANPEQKMLNFFRKGEIGNWKNYFTVAQSEMVDKLVEKKLSGTGINFIYE